MNIAAATPATRRPARRRNVNSPAHIAKLARLADDRVKRYSAAKEELLERVDPETLAQADQAIRPAPTLPPPGTRKTIPMPPPSSRPAPRPAPSVRPPLRPAPAPASVAPAGVDALIARTRPSGGLLQAIRTRVMSWAISLECWAGRVLETPLESEIISWRDNLRWWIEGKTSAMWSWAYDGSDEELASVFHGEIPPRYMSKRQLEVLIFPRTEYRAFCCAADDDTTILYDYDILTYEEYKERACGWEGTLAEATPDFRCPCCGHTVHLEPFEYSDPPPARAPVLLLLAPPSQPSAA